jgi:hypothetical protein
MNRMPCSSARIQRVGVAAVVGLLLALGACAKQRVARPDSWTVLHPALPAATGPDGAWSVGGLAANPRIDLRAADVAGRWLRFGGTVADPSAELQFLVNVYREQTLVMRSVPSLCDAARRCSTVVWIPPDATSVAAFVYTFAGVGSASSLTVEVGNPEPADRRDLRRVADLLAALQESYYRSGDADWPAIAERVAAMPPAPSDVDPLPVTAQYIREQLPGNKHMFVVPSASIKTGARTAGPPTCSMRADAIGLAVVPGISAIEGDGPARYATALHDCLLAAPDDRPWVVDLRVNGGGNMYPMIAGLSPLLPEGPLYAFVDGRGAPTAQIAIGPTGVTVDGEVGSIATPDVGSRTRAPVVVVIGPRCGSSCEQVANALSARPRTLFVGQDSGGYTTGNFPHALNDDYLLLVTSGYTGDPCGRPIADRLHPDVVVDRVDDLSVAEVLAAPGVGTWLATMRQHVARPVSDIERNARCAAASGLQAPTP